MNHKELSGESDNGHTATGELCVSLVLYSPASLMMSFHIVDGVCITHCKS